MVKAIVFDLGGVLIDLDFDRSVRAFREILGYEKITEILDLYHQKGIYGEMEGGQITADEFRAEVLKDSRPGCVGTCQGLSHLRTVEQQRDFRAAHA